MTVDHLWLTVAATIGFAVSLCAQVQVDPETIPNGYDFPRPEAVLNKWLQRGNQSRLRWHAWRVFEGLTATGKSGLPRWRTWYTKDTALSPDPEKIHLLSEQFEIPVKLQSALTSQMNMMTPEEKAAQVHNVKVISTVFLDPVTVQTIRTPIPGSPPVRLWCRGDVEAMNDRFTANDTPLEMRTIPDFPKTAMAVKAVWAVISAQGITELRVWDPPPANLILPRGNTKETFHRMVRVDPSPATCIKPGLVCLDRFYGYQLTKQDADRINSMVGIGLDAQPKDHLVLLGMHFTTKEIKNWVWATFWWHDQQRRGLYARDRPRSLRPPWASYLMDVSYDMDRPETAPGVPHICFNPYLEAVMPGGTVSNCMTCHRRAAVGLEDSRNDIYRGVIEREDPMFRGTTKTDFLWSLVMNRKKCPND